MRWSVDTDPLVVLYAEPSLVKKQVFTRQLHRNNEDIREKQRTHGWTTPIYDKE